MKYEILHPSTTLRVTVRLSEVEVCIFRKRLQMRKILFTEQAVKGNFITAAYRN